MDNPKPVPPYSRTVETSAWVKVSKIIASLSGETPMPVSRIENVSHSCSSVCRNPGHLYRDAALAGELHGVAQQVIQYLRELQRIGIHHLRNLFVYLKL